MKRMVKAIFVLSLLLGVLAMAQVSQAQVAVGVSIRIGPPALPVYAQPICPGAGYIWTPGYWAYGPAGYYWVPGTWVIAPAVGVLWTPGYWGWGGGVYMWHGGYWGPHVGFYGGINYGYGYTGSGFYGGEWRGGVYHYNTAVTQVNTTVIHNTYNTTVINNHTTVNNVSYNGGNGGINAQPTAAERAAAQDHHIEATSMQRQHEEAARGNRALLASENHGRPAIAATAKPGEFNGHGVVAAQSGNVNANRPNSNEQHNAAHPGQTDRPPSARTNGDATPNQKPATMNTSKPAQTQNASHPNNEHPNNAHPSNAHPQNEHPANSHPSNNHPNSEHPAPTHPTEPHQHPSGHFGGKAGR